LEVPERVRGDVMKRIPDEIAQEGGGKQPEVVQADQDRVGTAIQPIEHVLEVELVLGKFDVNKPLSQIEVAALQPREVLEFGIAVGKEGKRRAMSVVKFVASHKVMLRDAKRILKRPGKRTDLISGCKTWKAYVEKHFPCSVRHLDSLLVEDEAPYIDAKVTLLLTDGKAEETQERRDAESATTKETDDDGDGQQAESTYPGGAPKTERDSPDAERAEPEAEPEADVEPDEAEEEPEEPPVDEAVKELAFKFGELFAGFDADPLPQIRAFILALSERVRRSVIQAVFEIAGNRSLGFKDSTPPPLRGVGDSSMDASATDAGETESTPPPFPAEPKKLGKEKAKKRRRERATEMILDKLKRSNDRPASAWDIRSIRLDDDIKALGLSNGELAYVLSLGIRQGLWVKKRYGRDTFWKLPEQETKPAEAQRVASGA
jgi:hypothetical protein